MEEIEDFGFDRLKGVKGRLRDLFELRAIFEPQAAALACRRATQEERSDILEMCIRDRVHPPACGTGADTEGGEK